MANANLHNPSYVLKMQYYIAVLGVISSFSKLYIYIDTYILANWAAAWCFRVVVVQLRLVELCLAHTSSDII